MYILTFRLAVILCEICSPVLFITSTEILHYFSVFCCNDCSIFVYIRVTGLLLNPYSADIFVFKPWRPKECFLKSS